MAMGTAGQVNIVSPGAYVVCDVGGDVGLSPEQGLFYRDTRHLSRYGLKVDGVSAEAMDHRKCGTGTEFCSTSAGGSGRLDVSRRRTLGNGMEEEVLLSNRSGETLEVRVELEFEADFLDLFEVRGYARASSRREVSQEMEDGSLRFDYVRGDFQRGTVVRVSGEGMEPVAEPGRISLRVRIGPGETRAILVSVSVEEDGSEIRWDREPAKLYGEAPTLETEWKALDKSWRQSLADLGSLAFDAGEGLQVPAAGAPWYMALFGRDALITAYQTMLLDVEPAKNTLRALARHQARDYDDFRDAEPGKIPHEIRHGELAHFGEVPHSPYYGTADATPLFLILLGEVWRWTANVEFVRELEQPARQAISWMLQSMNSNESGYIAYETRSSTGLQNHGWKDSPNSILFRDGRKAKLPISLCEVQGYAYDALSRTVVLAERVWEDWAFAGRLREKAGELKVRFDRDFWMEDLGYYALALDGSGCQVDSVTSNAGHLLWSGIVPEDKARAVADRLLSPELFSGWGIRTMGSNEGGYDPASYHNGSVWPHDNALISEGLRRYGFREEALQVATALIEAAPHFDYRLPEVFTGYPREEVSEPGELPRACSPQSWAAGTVPLLVKTLLGAEPDSRSQRLLFNPLPGSPNISLKDAPSPGDKYKV